MTESQREMVAVMFTDVSGYSALAQQNEALALRLLEIKRNIADPVIAEYHGHLIKTIGDALMVEFKSALDAARCAAALQQRLYEHNLVVPAEQQISVRIGVHMGDVVRKGDDIFGDTVNIAARVEPQAPPGGIAVTHAVYEQIRNKFELPLSGLGSFHLKGIDGGTVLYAVVLPWGPIHPKGPGQRAVPLRLYAGIGAALLTVVAALGLWRSLSRHDAGSQAAVPAAAVVPAQSVAVLPFENLSGDPNNAYFSAGIQDEILTRLAQVGALKVVSRTSTLKYASHPENLKTVGLELGVAAVLEGSVQRSGDTARINVQLIDTATDTHLWAETYDRDMKDIFSAENDVATKIADALKAKLQPQESARIAEIPTHDTTAYDLYLQAEYKSNSIQDQLLGDKDSGLAAKEAIGLYGAAIAHDPAFMLAYARRSCVESLVYFNSDAVDTVQIVQARKDAERALELDPTAPAAHLAMGYVHYYGERDYAKALVEYDQAAKVSPNDPDVLQATAMVHRRRGEFDAAIQGFQKAAALDPGNQTRYLQYIESSQTLLGRYDDAHATVDRVAALHPGSSAPSVEHAFLYILQGQTDRAQAILQDLPRGSDADEDSTIIGYFVAYYRRDPQAMLRALAPVSAPYLSNFPVSLLLAKAYKMTHDDAKTKIACLETSGLLLPRQRTEAQNPNLWEMTGYFEAVCGSPNAAIAAAKRAVALIPMSADALNAPEYLGNLAAVEAYVGDVPAALSDLETLLSRPHGNVISIPVLKLDPDWDLVRKDPRFEALLEKYSSVKF